MDNLQNGITLSLALHALAFGALPAIAPLGGEARPASPLVVQVHARLSPAATPPAPAPAPTHNRTAARPVAPPAMVASDPAITTRSLATTAAAPSPSSSAAGVQEAASPSPALPGPRAHAEAAAPAAQVSPPRFDANYLRNPAPAYPALSRRLREQGRVVLRVRVNTAGAAEDVAVQSSSGSMRLDEAARETVLHWSFVPARRGSEPIAAWVLVPISFRLDG